jgi:hypothetical protein
LPRPREPEVAEEGSARTPLTITIDLERRELVGAVRIGRDRFSFRAESFAGLERECRRSARIVEGERAKRAASRLLI